jgi:hypothetical protein
MVMGEFEIWNIIIGAAITPAVTIVAAAITASGFVLSTVIISDVAQKALTGQQDLQKQLVEKISVASPKFF